MAGLLLRVRKPLSTGHKPGDFVHDSRFSPGNVAALISVGAVDIVRGPPLTELDKRTWGRHLAALEEADVTTVVEFILADEAMLQAAMGYKTAGPVKRLKEMALDAVRPDGEE